MRDNETISVLLPTTHSAENCYNNRQSWPSRLLSQTWTSRWQRSRCKPVWGNLIGL